MLGLILLLLWMHSKFMGYLVYERKLQKNICNKYERKKCDKYTRHFITIITKGYSDK